MDTTDRTIRTIHVSAPGHRVHHTMETTWTASGNVSIAPPWCGSERFGGWRNVPGTTRTDWCQKPGCVRARAKCAECNR